MNTPAYDWSSLRTFAESLDKSFAMLRTGEHIEVLPPEPDLPAYEEGLSEQPCKEAVQVLNTRWWFALVASANLIARQLALSTSIDVNKRPDLWSGWQAKLPTNPAITTAAHLLECAKELLAARS